MSRLADPEKKKALCARLARIEGQLRGLQKVKMQVTLTLACMNLKKLAKQYFQYGSWRSEVMRQHPETKKLKSAFRYFTPPITLIGILFGLLIGSIGFITNSRLALFSAIPLTYVLFTLVSSFALAKKAKSGTKYLPLVLPTMQLSWGAGFLLSQFRRKI